MNRIRSLGTTGLAILLLFACNPATGLSPEPIASSLTAVSPHELPTLPLSQPGMYFPGNRTYAFEDASRDNRKVEITVWYPAIKPEGFKGTVASDAAPDLQDAPYPLIISSTKVARIFAPYLVSHGFAWASVNGIDSYSQMNEQMIDQPLDILFALDKVASSPPDSLENVINADFTGAIGYSFDGYNALAVSGARIDPAYYLAQCPKPDATTEQILSVMSAFGCNPAQDWGKFVAHAGELITTSEDGLWQPMTDKRIRAVIPLAGEGWWLFGEKGLAAVDRPTLMIAATQDELYPENALIFEHLGTSDKRLISFVGPDHMMVYDTEMVARMAHFAVAFLGYHLQGREEYTLYFSEDFVAQYADLAWGVYLAK